MQIDHTQIRNILTNKFNETELRNLCFDMKIEYESLNGSGKADKARELVLFCQRHDRDGELLTMCKNLHPNAFKTDRDDEQYKPSHNLPHRPYTRFIGRDKERQEVIQCLLPQSPHFLIALDGTGGVGKSSLALEVAYYYLDEYTSLSPQERYEVIIWVSAKNAILDSDGIFPRESTNTTARV